MTVNSWSTAYSYSCYGVSRFKKVMPPQDGKSFSSSVMVRILRALLENGTLKKSNLCSKAGLNYSVCTKYVDFLTQLQWMKIHKTANQNVIISISEEGIENLRKLESETNESNKESQLLSQNHQEKTPSESTGSNSDIIRSEHLTGTADKEIRVRKKVIIIDDDSNALATYGAFLENDKNFEVQTFSNSKKALEYLTLNPGAADLILLDIRMPEMSGLRLYQAVKAVTPGVGVVFISSLDAGPELAELFSDPTHGTRNFLRKPISRANFIEAVTRATGI